MHARVDVSESPKYRTISISGMKLIIESSQVPIYNRIARAFASALMDLGHTVYLIDAEGFNEENFVQTVNNIEIDYYFSTNELNKVQSRSENESHFLFERINKNLIFIHHDNIFSCYNDIEIIAAKLNAFKSANNYSKHFFLEESNVRLFKNYGISHASKISHASEFKPDLNSAQLLYGTTFIGHLMSSLKLYPESQLQSGHHLAAQAWQRLSDSSHAIQPAIKHLASDNYIASQHGQGLQAHPSAIHQYLIAGLNKLSSAYRGELLSKIASQRIDIFGGDLSYGKLSDPLLVLDRPNIYYQPATTDYIQAKHIYQGSRVNINISSLQFDSAINNRVIDAVMAGGFILTDDRTDLNFLGELKEYITYRCPEELEYKVHYWMSEKNHSKYLEVKDALYKRISNVHTYQSIINTIFDDAHRKEK